MFKALILKKKEEDDKAFGTVEDINISDLPEGDVLVKINYSTLNYKDSLAITSSSPIVKSFPMIPGIDFCGEIEQTSNENFKVGDASISQKHCNFFINNGNAKSADIENLIKKVKKKVYEKTGANLELEIKIIGE